MDINPRVQLDRLFAFDAAISVVFGLLALLAPHGIISKIGGGYNHSVHETLRFVFHLFLLCTHSLSVSLSLERTSVSVSSASFISLPRVLYRLYGCLRLACGWILWHVRPVDDGRFRKHICEALFVCYVLQALAVIRAQFTDRRYSIINWIAIALLMMLASAYGSFRFRKGGNLIKIYELPTSANLM
jgi:hypothetical protein